MRSISVCVATYKRLEGLRALLESIENQVLEPGDEVEIIVVDNDPRTSEESVHEFAETSRFTVVYLTQPEQNISLTRNVAVEAATGEYLWFVDDDEVAIPECLSRLIKALEDYDADGVFGPVLPSFEADPPSWMEGSSIFNREIGVTGERSEGNRTSNTLVRASTLSVIPGPFDRDFGISGGSDSMLFRQLAEQGALFIDSADAFVYEAVPANRANWTWMKARSRRQGQNYGRQTVMLSDGVRNKSVAIMLAKATILLVGSAGGAALTWRDRAKRSEFLLRLATNVGKFEGVRGVVTERML